MTTAPDCTPDTARYVAAIAYLADPWRGDNYPTTLLHDCEARWRAWEAQEGRNAPHGPSAYATAGYCLGRRDGSLAAEEDDDQRAGRGLAMGLMWCGGFLCCLGLVVIGFALSH